ncbi:MAG: hypothetical protein IKF54_04015 [Eubacterium sp.]|nr:hypothetical protein [Eubacterium sp.]
MYNIRMGLHEMAAYWSDLKQKIASDTATRQEKERYNKLGKALVLLARDPKYPGLHSHEIPSLSSRTGFKVWESYLENNTPAAGRLFWAYGPDRNDITILGIEPHPNDKSHAYRKVTLSSMGEIIH